MRRTVLLLSVIAATAGAQVPSLAIGSRLKVETTDHRKIEGTLMSQRPDSLTIAANGALMTSIASDRVGRIKSTMGKSHGAGAMKGMKLGTMIGGGLGLLSGLIIMTDDTYDSGFNRSAAPAVFGIAGAAEGCVYGVLIGAIVGAQDWKTVYERPYTVSVVPTANGARLGLALKF